MFGLGKSKKEEWTGVVLKKGQGTNYDEDGTKTTYWTLDVKRDDSGKKKHYVVGRGNVSADLYNSLNEGDKVTSHAGTNKLEKA